eukprot:CAMPEP_0118659188 /NCGR_PEP_ID=MMETSP0785-20121206/14975_1 /TAXON_ID=91992 /ORGANISM="Bolidomonas pacifica, Strain CCMP 1866" /LENGTH=409 /DNA_ID=CAMNT_0006552269 /DNA_START=271 /DNA_END=1497 /DNA_ORIENTATION=+
MVSLPAILNFAINPLIGAIDLFWVGRMSNALSLAGQSAANQVFTSAFWIISFLPSVTTPLVAKHWAAGEKEKARDVVCQAMILGSLLGIFGTSLILLFPEFALSSVLKADAPAMKYALPYLRIRALAFLPSLISTVGFSAFRGKMDTVTPLKISGFANLFNAVLDPIMIFKMGWGVSGAAAATVVAEFISFFSYVTLLTKAKMVRLKSLFSLPSWTTLKPLISGGASVQLRAVALNIVFLAVTRATQTLDKTGVAAAAHSIAIQVFNVGGIFLLALSTVAAFLVPSKIFSEGEVVAKRTVNRLMGWGLVLGSVLGGLQLLLLPFISIFTPLKDVQKAARIPSIIASVLQVINGLVFIGEGVMQGCGNFLTLALSNVVACGGMMVALHYFVMWWGLTGVWASFGVFNGLR